jgi:hypothetical protein
VGGAQDKERVRIRESEIKSRIAGRAEGWKKGRTNPLVMLLVLIVMFETTSPVSIEPYALFSMLHGGKESSRRLGYYSPKGSELLTIDCHARDGRGDVAER